MQTNQQKIEKFKKQVIEMKELALFLTIEELGSILWREKHEFCNGRLEISKQQFKDNQIYHNKLQTECVLMLKKFNVNPDSVKDRNNVSYWKWYEFWKNWMDSFSNEGWSHFNKKYSEKEDIGDLLPKKRWNE